jgi:hypothetical protein
MNAVVQAAKKPRIVEGAEGYEDNSQINIKNIEVTQVEELDLEWQFCVELPVHTSRRQMIQSVVSVSKLLKLVQ